ncbi:MAG: hypothetical protein A3I89_01450 [Candidatus Harrisonbacteria bacterium RIFCSPLOWO2_02_FULL_41_11]|uniref:Uncharacterized protein n=1 Tax=Candidatus Harrisonbacteria bacterium RIFCSPHIGHO2_02_FULL_42_16 TaxID=1798404 RepID=A0A1G1ZH15_9BACT|nr:MAG: hypothetical protein A3B92_04040 [Candidatus Harrisonbacteria bacterium RIFCSPHIGHO2_02_FULL_42_16]OGY66721.1 MAG: hypothetical protein A3I89_01450 [Candidatus Harrisonbacteria bacterium RIFCSPLOWO2_02_FULL_41_11]
MRLLIRIVAGILAFIMFGLFLIGLLTPSPAELYKLLLFVTFLKVAKIPFLTKWVSAITAPSTIYFKKKIRTWKHLWFFQWMRWPVAKVLKQMRSWRNFKKDNL